MKISHELKEILEGSTGHRILNIDDTINALRKSGINVTVEKDGLWAKLNGTKSFIPLISEETTNQEKNINMGIEDFTLIFSVIDLSEKNYDGGMFETRRQQYKACLEWLMRNGLINSK